MTEDQLREAFEKWSGIPEGYEMIGAGPRAALMEAFRAGCEVGIEHGMEHHPDWEPADDATLCAGYALSWQVSRPATRAGVFEVIQEDNTQIDGVS